MLSVCYLKYSFRVLFKDDYIGKVLKLLYYILISINMLIHKNVNRPNRIRQAQETSSRSHLSRDSCPNSESSPLDSKIVPCMQSPDRSQSGTDPDSFSSSCQVNKFPLLMNRTFFFYEWLDKL